MKRTTLLFVMLLAMLSAYAQEEIAIEQNINQRINKLVVGQGWDVHLIHTEADSSYRVAIITEDDLAVRAYNVQLCNVKEQTLNILENTQLPRGTVVEIEGPTNFSEIFLCNRAKVEADYVVASAASVPKEWNNLELSDLSHFHVRHYHIPSHDNSPVINIWDHAQLTIDSISGEGNAEVKVYRGNFQYGTNTLQGKITLTEYEYAKWPYQQKDSRIIKTKQVDGEWETTDHRKVWGWRNIRLDVSFGYRMGINPTNANSPFLNNGTLSINTGATTYFQLGNRLDLRTGLRWNTDIKFLSHQVKYEDNTLVVVDGQEDFQRNRLISDYIGVLISLDYYLGPQSTESFSLDFFCGYLISKQLSISVDPTKLFGFKNWKKEKVDGIFNPWKIEVGLSFNTQHLGFFHGIRVFTNLLPEYKPGVTTDKFRSVGIEIKL